MSIAALFSLLFSRYGRGYVEGKKGWRISGKPRRTPALSQSAGSRGGCCARGAGGPPVRKRLCRAPGGAAGPVSPSPPRLFRKSSTPGVYDRHK